MKEELKKMPKIELHLHLDGSVSIDLLSELSNLPRGEVIGKVVSIKDKSLKDYLEHFHFVNEFLQTKENLELASYDLGKRLDLENVIYAEIRFAPLLHTKGGLSLDEIVLAILSGLKKCQVKTNLILCMQRGETKENNMKVINLANRFLNKGVVAVDLVGDEASYPFKDYEYLFKVCEYANIPFTIHSGETSTRDIMDVIPYTKRIGHGIKIWDNEELIKEIKKRKILLEVCPNSNVDTKAFLDYASHPIKMLYDKGVRVCISTDNRTVSKVTLTKEYEDLVNTFNFTIDDLIKMNLNAIDGAFIPKQLKDDLKEVIIGYKKKTF